MTNPMSAILTRLEKSHEPLSIQQISIELGMNPALVLDMLHHYERRGKIRITAENSCQTPDRPTCEGCPVANCTLTTAPSKRYEIIRE